MASLSPASAFSVVLALSMMVWFGCGDARLYPLRYNTTEGGINPTDGPMDGPMDAATEATLVAGGCPNIAAVGFATLTSPGSDGGPPQMGTTGGGNEPAVTVSTLDDFTSLAADKNPRVIEVSGLIAFPAIPEGGTGERQVKVSSNKTIVGADANSGFTGGGLFVDDSSNVIIRNLRITRAFGTDAITVQASTNIWIDHCDLSCDPAQPTACDGLVDITHASDFVTVSWTAYHDHDASGLVGHSDSNAAQDTDHLTVTYHHDLFSKVTTGPRMRFGTVHLFNVDFSHLTDYAVASTMGAHVLVERSVFDDVRTPLTTTVPSSPDPGFLTEGSSDRANSYLAPTVPANNNITTTPPSWSPKYDYASALDSTASGLALVQQCAGTGKIGAPLPVPTP